MSFFAWIRAIFAALLLVGLASREAKAGFSYVLPPDSTTIQSLKRNNVFFVGEAVEFQIGNPTNRYEVRDYYGNLVDQGPIQGISFRVNAIEPGWYKVDIFGTREQGEPWGQLVGGTMFCIFRNKPGFPTLPPPDPSTYSALDDETVRGVTGMGPQRHYVTDTANPDSDIARIRQEIDIDKQLYLPFDPVRQRRLLIAFPAGTSNLVGVRRVVEAFKDDVKYFEPRNEPNSGSSGPDFVTNELIPFYQTVKSVDPTLKVLGPGVVTIGPYGLAWTEAFLLAGGGNYIDAFSFHAYNNVNGDPFLAMHSLEELDALLARYNLGNIEKWQTEQGYMAAVNGSFQPRLQGRWTMLQMMIYEQYGIPKEHNHLWYDRSRGFWGAPMWWENFDSSLMPAPALMRVWSEELYGTKFTKTLGFGNPGDKIYLGSLFTGPGKSVATFMCGGSTDGHVELAVSGGNSIHYVNPWGLEYDLPVTAGRVTIPVPELPVYVELAPGQNIEVIPADWGPNLLLQQGVTGASSGSGANPFPNIPQNIGKLFNQTHETWYYGQNDNDWPWMASLGTSPTWVELDLPTLQTIDRVVVYASPPWQLWGTLVDYELQYYSNGQWITLEHVQEPTKTWKSYTTMARSTVDSYFSDRFIFQHAFAPVQTQKIRLLVHSASWGGGATEDVYNAGGQASTNNICLREIEIYNASSVGVGTGTSGGNSPPKVNLYAPVDNSLYSAPANITISASALDLDGSIAKVEFFANGAKLGEKTAGQYSYVWNNVPPGHYLVTARATDNSGATADASPVYVTVGANGTESVPVIGSGTGLTGQYFASTDFTLPRLTRLDPAVSFDWAGGSPDSTIPADMFTVRWTGKIEPKYTETYTFYTQSDDGSRVWINGQQIINNWGIHAWEEHSGSITLQAGHRYDITIEYLEWGGGALVKFLWSSTRQPKDIVPTSQLYPAGTPAQPPPPAPNASPTVSITGPLEGSVFPAPASLVLQAGAADADGSVSRVEFFADNYKLGESTTAPFTYNWTGMAAGTYAITAKAHDNLGASTVSAPVHVTVTAGNTPASVQFIRTDTATRGNWKGIYGGDGFNVIGTPHNYPSYATVTSTGNGSYIWTPTTTNAVALQKPSSAERIAGCWYSSNDFTIDVDITDGQVHSLALYVLDWDGFGPRAERVEVFNAATGALLDSHLIPSYRNGQYLVWDASGHIQIRVTNTAPHSGAAVSGLFFGRTNIVSNPLTVNITSPANGTVVTAPWNTVISADAVNTDGIVSKVEFYSGSTKLGESTSAPYTLNWNNVLPGTYNLTAIAHDGAGLTVTSLPARVTVNPPIGAATVTYIKSDAVTQGSWKGTYGSDGVNVIGQTPSYPSYATVTSGGYATWTWNLSTFNAAAVQKISSADRIASCWYSANTFTVDVNLTDGQSHGLALYALDWDSFGPRAQTVEILDAATGAVVDTRSLSSFTNGHYLVWDAKGHFQIRVTNANASANAVISGLFFGPPARPQTPYENWASSNGLSGANFGPTTDYDGDSATNFMEWAFGTNPKVASPGSLSVNAGTIIKRGSPTTLAASVGSGHLAAFGRRKDYATTGLTYTVQFSNDMATWVSDWTPPTVIADDGEIEIVTVPYPPTPDGRNGSFFRVIVNGP